MMIIINVYFIVKTTQKINKFVSNKFKYKGTFSHFNNLITFNNYKTLFISNNSNINHYNEFIDPSNNSYNINYILNNFKDYHISNNNYLLFILQKIMICLSIIYMILIL